MKTDCPPLLLAVAAIFGSISLLPIVQSQSLFTDTRSSRGQIFINEFQLNLDTDSFLQFQCSLLDSNNVRIKAQACLSEYTYSTCVGVNPLYIELASAACTSKSSVAILGGVMDFTGRDSPSSPELVQNCVRNAFASETCLNAFKADYTDLNAIQFTLYNTAAPTIVSSTTPPTVSPTLAPVTSSPTSMPTLSPVTSSPTLAPVTSSPTRIPTLAPVTSSPTAVPTLAPVTSSPTGGPTLAPITSAPTDGPTLAPATSRPTSAPITSSPTVGATTSNPTLAPITSSPTTSAPVEVAVAATAEPTIAVATTTLTPTSAPIETIVTDIPSSLPVVEETEVPVVAASVTRTAQPTFAALLRSVAPTDSVIEESTATTRTGINNAVEEYQLGDPSGGNDDTPLIAGVAVGGTLFVAVVLLLAKRRSISSAKSAGTAKDNEYGREYLSAASNPSFDDESDIENTGGKEMILKDLASFHSSTSSMDALGYSKSNNMLAFATASSLATTAPVVNTKERPPSYSLQESQVEDRRSNLGVMSIDEDSTTDFRTGRTLIAEVPITGVDSTVSSPNSAFLPEESFNEPTSPGSEVEFSVEDQVTPVLPTLRRFMSPSQAISRRSSLSLTLPSRVASRQYSDKKRENRHSSGSSQSDEEFNPDTSWDPDDNSTTDNEGSCARHLDPFCNCQLPSLDDDKALLSSYKQKANWQTFNSDENTKVEVQLEPGRRRAFGSSDTADL